MHIYKTTNLINGKIYVGKQVNPWRGYLGSGKVLKLAVKKYGKENFRKEILQECSTKQELSEAEIYWIKTLDATNPKIGYNRAKGGDGWKFHQGMQGKHHSEETKRKIREKGKLYKPSDITKNNISKTLTGKRKGIRFSDEHKDKLKLAWEKRKIENPISEEIKNKIRNSLKGRKYSEEQKMKKKQEMKLWWSLRKDNFGTTKKGNT